MKSDGKQDIMVKEYNQMLDEAFDLQKLKNELAQKVLTLSHTELIELLEFIKGDGLREKCT